MREKNKEQHKKHHRFNMSFDNLAIPEVNTKSHDDNEDNVGEDDSSGCVRIQSGDFYIKIILLLTG